MAVKGIKAIVSTPPHHIELIDDIMGGVAEPVLRFGFQNAMTHPVNDVWSGTAVTIPFPTQPGGEQMQVVSTSAQDGVAGTGILTLMIHYLDSSGNEQDETVTMNGVANVNTVATNIRFINEVHAATTGSSLSAVGTITIHKFNVAGTVYTQIDPGRTHDLNTAFMVPAGKTFVIEQFTASGGNGQRADIYLRSTDDDGLLLPAGLFVDRDAILVLNSADTRNYPIPLVIPSLSMVKCTAFSPVDNADIQASFEGILVNNPT